MCFKKKAKKNYILERREYTPSTKIIIFFNIRPKAHPQRERRYNVLNSAHMNEQHLHTRAGLPKTTT
jgi:hypothetical protein